MKDKQELSYQELKRRLSIAEAALQAVRDKQTQPVTDEGEMLVTRLAKTEAREAHIKQVLLAIRNVNQLIVAERTPQKLIEGACENLTATLGYHNAWIALLDDAGNVTLTASAGFNGGFKIMATRLKQGTFPACMQQTLEQKRLIVTQAPITACHDCPLSGTYIERAALTHRLAYKDKDYGVLSVAVPVTYADDTEEQAFFKELTGDLAFALHKIEKETQLERLQYITTTIPQPMSFVSQDYRYLAVNDIYTEFYNETKEQILGRTIADFFGESVFESEIKPQLDRCLAGEPVHYEVLVDFPGKGKRWMQMDYYPYRDESGAITGVISHGLDITARKHAEAALQESEARFRQVYEHMAIGVARVSLQFRIKDANEAYCHMLGYREEELIGKHLKDITHPEVIEENLRRQAQLGAGEIDHYRMEKQFIHKSGRTIYGILDANLVRDEQGNPLYFLGSVVDITERKQIEKTLQENEEQLSQIIHGSSIATLVIDKKHQIRHWNKACERLTGLSARDMCGTDKQWVAFYTEKRPTMADIIVSELTDRQIKTYYRDTYKESPLIKGAYEAEDFFPILGEKGKWLFFTAAPLVDQNGEITGAIETIQDISERKQMEEERESLLKQISEQAQQVQQIIETVPEGVLLIDNDNRVILANPIGEKYLAALANIQVGDTLTHLSNQPLGTLLTPQPQGLWHEVKLNTRSFEIIARPMENGPEPERWVLVIKEVTREREIQQHIQQQEQLAAVGQLAAGIAHDFNNIMAVIVLYIQMGLRHPDLPAKLREKLQVIDQQANHATDLIQQILDFSRRAVLELRPMDLAPFIKELVKLLERTIPEHITIDLDLETDDYTVKADPTRLQQAIMNLAFNARDAMDRGGTLRIALERVAVEDGKTPPLPDMKAGPWVKLSIADTGTGIPADAMPHIFEPFFTTKEPGKGSGLGLPQVHGIVGQHGGCIGVETQIGEGTTFTIYLPTLVDHPSKDTHHQEVTHVQGKGETILIVEDNDILREALTDTLTILNYQVLEAPNGHEALHILEQHPKEISLILSDLVMPEMGGQALFHTLKKRGITLPMVVLTGHPLQNELKALQTQGLAGWILKPLDIEQLSRILSTALKQQPEQNNRKDS